MYQLLAENVIQYKAYTIAEENISIQRKVLHYYTTLLIGHLQIFGTLKGTKMSTNKEQKNKDTRERKSPQMGNTKY